jgi:hypothetical protein
VERGRGKATEWVFRTPAQKWYRDMIQTYDCHKNMKVMVLAVFWDTERTSLYIIDRDFESKKHGYSAASYLEVLEAQVSLKGMSNQILQVGNWGSAKLKMGFKGGQISAALDSTPASNVTRSRARVRKNIL